MKLKINKIESPLQGQIDLAGSKSISNRLLIIRALCDQSFEITGLANADDSIVLEKVLQDDPEIYDVHHAGTSYRFLCSYLCLQKGKKVLTGSTRMLERPIGPLVNALRQLGANIDYLGEEAYPPLKIAEANWRKLDSALEIDATISSQFISSLLLIAPVLPYGLKLKLVGKLVSRPYLEMTLNLMGEFGIDYSWEEDIISIEPQKYQAQDYRVEADWSAASYYLSLVALVPGSTIHLSGLRQKSIQGDSAIIKIMEEFGVESSWESENLIITHRDSKVNHIEHDFLLHPDLAQTVSVACAGRNMTGLFSGLQTLKVKETDRIAALQNELIKVQVFISKLPSKFSKKSSAEFYIQEGVINVVDQPCFATYKDHRMAMSFSVLAALGDIIIEDATVVSKSYPKFWEDLESLGVVIEEV